MYKASCHCGNVQITVAELTETTTSCNCSICNRFGALWMYYKADDLAIQCEKTPTVAYIWGDKTIEFHHCPLCGCTTHYLSVDKENQRAAINGRMFNLDIITSIKIRKFDGAVSWQYLDV